MNGVQAAGAFPANGAFPASGGFPATRVLRIATSRPIQTPDNCQADERQADEVILAALTHPPRIGQTRPLADLLPQVLARYGLVEEAATQHSPDAASVDLLA